MQNNPNPSNPKQGQPPNVPPTDPNRQGPGGGQQAPQRPNQGGERTGQPNMPGQQPPRKSGQE